jgi:hypothetical protein
MADTRICEIDRIGQIKATCALFKPPLYVIVKRRSGEK